MGVIQRVVKPRNQKSKRALEAREPKPIENAKSAIFIRGPKSSDMVMKAMRDIHALKKPNVAPSFYGKKNPDVRPFESGGSARIEFFSRKHDSSLFVVGSHSKKKPHNLVLGRMYDGHLLDMIELGITEESFKSLSDFQNTKVPMGTKPCLLFSGDAFENDPTMKRAKSLLIDMFRGESQVTNVRLTGLELSLQFTAVSTNGSSGPFRILFRCYRIITKKSDNVRLPRVELEEIGPRMDLSIRRTHLASDDLFKTACKQIKNAKRTEKRKTKNITDDGLGGTLGRIHVPAQNVGDGTLQTRKMKGLKDTPEEKKAKQLLKLKEKRSKAENARKANVAAVFAEENGN